MTDRLAEVTVPALVLCGRHDWVTPVEPAADRLRGGLADAELVVFEDSGHYPFIEEQTRFVEIVRDWLARRCAGALA